MIKWTLRIVSAVAALLVVAFLVFRTPDTDAQAMRAKYGGSPSQFVSLGGGRSVHLRDEGPREALPVILLHGSNADLHTWQPWAEALRGRYRVVRYDQIGHGLTGSVPGGDYSRTAMAADVGRVADALGLDRFVLAGNSMGGGVALEYALAHPERLAGLVLVDASGAPQLEEASGNIGFTLARTPGVSRLMAQVTPRSLVESSLDQSVSNKAVLTDAAVDRYWELLRYPGNREATIRRFGQAYRPFDEAQLGTLAVPTLVMWGEEDRLIPLSSGRWLAERIPGATLVTYTGIGHLPMEESPRESAADLVRWLSALPSPG